MREQLIAFLESLSLRYFAPEEFLINTDRPGNTLPPEEIWGNIALTAVLLDTVRSHFEASVVITSCYRAPEYNRRIGGRPFSQHQAFTAIDFSVAMVPAREGADFCRQLRGHPVLLPPGIRRVQWDSAPFKEIEEHRFVGGVGSYSRFVHIDTRGINATWRGH